MRRLSAASISVFALIGCLSRRLLSDGSLPLLDPTVGRNFENNHRGRNLESNHPDYYFSTASVQDLGWESPDAAAGNPLKGLICSPTFMDYDPNAKTIDSSMDLYYMGLNLVMFGDPDVVGVEKAFDWTYVEKRLNESFSRSRHAVLTVSLHYPGQNLFLPQFIWDKQPTLLYYPDFMGGGVSPDYGDPIILKAIEQFIRAFGAKYDGDTRIGFIHLGLLGFWGEWHTFPQNFVPEHAKHSVTQWYTESFSKTQLQARYPFDPTYKAGMGLYDGSFAFHTLDGDANGGFYHPEWYFWPLVQAAGQSDIWKKAALGGETRPELQKEIFTSSYQKGTYEKQDFVRCIYTTHATYIFHQDAFILGGYTGEQLAAAAHSHTRMGYSFIVSRVSVAESSVKGEIDIDVSVRQIGVAPFYYPLSILLDCGGLPSPKELEGVETIIDDQETKTFQFTGIPATVHCLNKVSFYLKSPYSLEGRPIKWAQGSDGHVSVRIPSPEGFFLDDASSAGGPWGVVDGFSLIINDDVNRALLDGDVIDLAEVGKLLIVEALTNGTPAATMTFRYGNSVDRVSNAPFLLNENVQGHGAAVPYLAYPGSKTITATAFNNGDEPVGFRSVTFEIVDSTPPPLEGTEDPDAIDGIHGFNTPKTPPLLDLVELESDSNVATIVAVVAGIALMTVLILLTFLGCKFNFRSPEAKKECCSDASTDEQDETDSCSDADLLHCATLVSQRPL